MNQSEQLQTPIRGFTMTGFLWALVAAFTGMLSQTQLFMGWPASDGLVHYGYLRPLFTGSLIFGAGLSFFFGAGYYMLKKESGAQIKHGWLAMIGLLLHQTGIAFGLMTILAGANKGREFGEFSWIADNMIALSLVIYLVMMVLSLKNVNQPSRGIMLSIVGAAGALAVFLLGNLGQPYSMVSSVPLFSGTQDMALQEFYRAGVYGFFILFPVFSILYFMIPAHGKTSEGNSGTANFLAMAMMILIPISGAAGLAYTHMPVFSVSIGITASIALTLAILAGFLDLNKSLSSASHRDSLSSHFQMGLILIVVFAVLRSIYQIPAVQAMVGFTWFNMNDLGVDLLTYGLIVFIAGGTVIMQSENNRSASESLLKIQWMVLIAGAVLILIGNIAAGFMQGANMAALNEEGALLYQDWASVLLGPAGDSGEAGTLTSRAVFSLHGLTLVGYVAIFIGTALGLYNILQTQKEDAPVYHGAA